MKCLDVNILVLLARTHTPLSWPWLIGSLLKKPGSVVSHSTDGRGAAPPSGFPAERVLHPARVLLSSTDVVDDFLFWGFICLIILQKYCTPIG